MKRVSLNNLDVQAMNLLEMEELNGGGIQMVIGKPSVICSY